MSTAAHLRKLYVRTDSTAPTGTDELDGAKDFSFTTSRTILDTTAFKDADTKLKQAGLKDGSGSISGDWEPTDTIQTILRTAFSNGSLVYVTDLPDGTNGFTFPCLVESVEVGGAVDDLVSVSFGLTQAAAAIVRP